MAETRTRSTLDGAVFGVVFVMLFAFSYSEQLISGLFRVLGRGDHGEWQIVVVAVDTVALAVVGVMKRAVTRADGDRPRLWGWWWTGFAILIAIDIQRSISPVSIRVGLLVSTIYAATMGLIMAVSLNADPLTLISSARRAALPTDWVRVRAVVPLVLGTWACYLAATAFVDYFDLDAVRVLDPVMAAAVEEMPLTERLAVTSQICTDAVSPAFFQHVVGVIPLLLLTLGVEFNYFRRALTDSAQRAATAATVSVLAAGLVLALSTLPWDGEGCGDVLSGWHEYVTFVVAVQGIFTGLATLVWLLVASAPDGAEGTDVVPNKDVLAD